MASNPGPPESPTDEVMLAGCSSRKMDGVHGGGGEVGHVQHYRMENEGKDAQFSAILHTNTTAAVAHDSI